MSLFLKDWWTTLVSLSPLSTGNLLTWRGLLGPKLTPAKREAHSTICNITTNEITKLIQNGSIKENPGAQSKPPNSKRITGPSQSYS